MKQQTIVFKVSDNIKEQMIEHYKDVKRDETPPYAVFQALEADTIVTLYESGKVMFQGISADVDANLWKDIESSVNKRDINAELAEKEAKDAKKKEELVDYRFTGVPTIGSDETGTGDYFGPIVVVAAFVDKSNMALMHELGVKDSKKITDDKILKIAPTIIKNVPHVSYILTNKQYNDKPTNMNKIKTLLHNRALYDLVNKNNFEYKYIVVDQFCHPRNYFSYLKEDNIENKITKITFTTKAEDKCMSVAAASIIGRYIFIKEFAALGDKYSVFLKKGAGLEVDKQGAELVKRYGDKILYDIAKLNFKNTDKINELLK